MQQIIFINAFDIEKFPTRGVRSAIWISLKNFSTAKQASSNTCYVHINYTKCILLKNSIPHGRPRDFKFFTDFFFSSTCCLWQLNILD